MARKASAANSADTNKTTKEHNFFPTSERPGTLIIVEGCDGSGKSTQLIILQKLLEANGFFCHHTEWNSNLLIKPLGKEIKKKDPHCPAVVFDLVFAADFMERYITEIKGKLAAGMVVLCDRYMYTALARGYARGLKVDDQRAFYDLFFPKPDLAFYFQLPVDVAAKRAIGRNPLKWYEAGMDMSFSENIIDSFMQFQTRVIAGYDQAAQTDHLHIIDGTKPVYETTPDVVRITAEYFKKKYHVSLGSAMAAASV